MLQIRLFKLLNFMGSAFVVSNFVCKLQLCLQNFRCQEKILCSAIQLHFQKPCFLHDFAHRNTVYALSTSPGISAVAIIRISGPNASNVLYKMGKFSKLPEARKAVLCRIQDPQTDELLDKALVLWFPSPNSFTGEDICELHIHGGLAVTRSILNALQKLPYFRLAEPGEFTKRAFLARKLDLTEVEGLADLLHAETEAQQKQALRQMEGALHKLYSDWSNRIKKCLARVEAYIDFSEDQHLDDKMLDEVKFELGILKQDISRHLLDNRRGEKLRSGVFTVLIGKPNVGKSSLLNNLCQRDIAIVSSTAGTTRDIIETSLNLGGYLVNISDTAGIRETRDFIEKEGVKRAREKSSKADVLIFILEAKRILEMNEIYNMQKSRLVEYLLNMELGREFVEYLWSNKNVTDESNKWNNEEVHIIIVVNKIDLLCEEDSFKVMQLENLSSSICVISCTKGIGMIKFISSLSQKVQDM